MSYHEGSNWQAKKEDKKDPLYSTSKTISDSHINEKIHQAINEYEERLNALKRAVNTSDYYIGQNVGMEVATTETITTLKSLLSALQELSGKGAEDIGFGTYCYIEQLRHGVPNEMYEHKIIKRLESNTYVDVPVQTPAKESWHEEIVPVVLCICCGVDEREVRKYRLSDVTIKSQITTPPQREGEFAEWLANNDYEWRDNGIWYLNGDRPTSHNGLFTTSELYKVFIKEKK